MVYLTIVKRTGELRDEAQINFTRPRSMKRGHVYRIYVHIDYVEDLSFYHYPADELRQDGRVPMRELRWQYGHMDGELEDEGILHTPTCRPGNGFRRPREDDDEDNNQGRKSRMRAILSRMTRCLDRGNQSRSKAPEPDRGSGWYKGEGSRYGYSDRCSDNLKIEQARISDQMFQDHHSSDAIHIVPVNNLFEAYEQYQSEINPNNCLDRSSTVIVIPLQEVVPPSKEDINRQVRATSSASNNAIEQLVPVNVTQITENPQIQANTREILPKVSSDGIAATTMDHSPNTMRLQDWMSVMVSAQKQPTQGEAPCSTQAESTMYQPHSPVAIHHSLSQVIDQDTNPTIQSDTTTHNLSIIPHDTHEAASKESGHRAKLNLLHAEITLNKTPPVLETPMSKKSGTAATRSLQPINGERRSPRLKSNEKQKPAIKLAQELLAKKWGILQPEQDLEERTLQQYLDTYKTPLDDNKMEAIKALSVVTTKKKTKKHKINTEATKKKKKIKKARAVLTEA